MFRLVRLESDPTREDRSMFRLKNRASPESQRSAPIKKHKFYAAQNPAPHKILGRTHISSDKSAAAVHLAMLRGGDVPFS